jgi:hypothetical protein
MVFGVVGIAGVVAGATGMAAEVVGMVVRAATGVAVEATGMFVDVGVVVAARGGI